MILAIACSGLPSSRAVASAISRSLATTSARHLVAGEVLRAHRGDLHGGAAGGLVVAVVLDEHADRRRQVGGALVHVGDDRAVEVGDRPSSIFSPMTDGQALDDLADRLPSPS